MPGLFCWKMFLFRSTARRSNHNSYINLGVNLPVARNHILIKPPSVNSETIICVLGRFSFTYQTSYSQSVPTISSDTFLEQCQSILRLLEQSRR